MPDDISRFIIFVKYQFEERINSWNIIAYCHSAKSIKLTFKKLFVFFFNNINRILKINLICIVYMLVTNKDLSIKEISNLP